MKTIQPSRFNNRIFLRERLTKGLKIRSVEAGNKYTILEIDLSESDKEKGIYCYVLEELWNYRELFQGVEYEIIGYKPEYEVELKNTLKVDSHKVDLYLENLKENRRIERQYREFKESKEFDLSGFFARDREQFNLSVC